MHIAIVGAGRIGSTFAFHLARSGHAVTVIARGARLQALQEAGAILTTRGEAAPIQVAETLRHETPFDLVLVTVLAHQVDALLPALVASAAKTILFLFNTFETTDRLKQAVGEARFAFGFPAMTAFLVDGRLKSEVRGPGLVTTLSSAPLAKLLEDAGMPTEVEPDMSSFLRSHVAFVVPLMVAGQRTWQRNTELSWSEAAELSAAMVEALALVQHLGHTLKPAFVGLLARLPTLMLTTLIWMLARWSGTKNLGEFGPGEVRALIDAMAASAPGRTPRLLAIRP